jgi:hypothetical protein
VTSEVWCCFTPLLAAEGRIYPFLPPLAVGGRICTCVPLLAVDSHIHRFVALALAATRLTLI